MSADTNDDTNLDAIFREVGEFGRYHIFIYLLISIPNIISSATFVNYMISATTLEYRCRVPECDVSGNNRDIPFDQPWLENAIPFTQNKIDRCHRYAPRNSTAAVNGQCHAHLFDTAKLIECSEYVYTSDEKNVQTEFNTHCGETYKLALVGTISSVGRFVFLPFSGLLADKYGRLKVVIIGMTFCSLIGLLKSFSVNYLMYLTLEFFEACVGTSTYAGSFVLGIELLTTRYRVLGSTIISISHPIGEVIFGLIAMHIHDFKHLLRITYIPGLFVFINFFLVPESIRWLLVTGRVDRAVKNLKTIARVNGKQLSETSVELLQSKYKIEQKVIRNKYDLDQSVKVEETAAPETFCMIFKSKTLCVRFIVCSYQWVACCFYYYGISLYATHIPGTNRYVSFLIVVSVEIPSILIALPLVNRTRRRILLFSTLLVAAISILATSFVPEEHSVITVIFSLIGKGSITFSFTLLYVFTAEQWPTNLRTTIMNSCSMIGRTGSMIAPFAVILGSQYGSLPALLFGASAIIAAIMVIFNPETYSKKLPDTIKEAKQI
ncbi:organic cation transporter-like protein isoform X1 [Bradysia coprophila]|uniref:organic cation transporter-like protein isoform X1 n=2 Tax=Bradysia coprophila TaxID=38358 RepID=UPI00187DD9A4|nr:organic cation transporter-like protein isoform X1 [Bradysia coprophila]